MTNGSNLRELFRSRFKTDAQIFRAPGRTNLIGEHTDYNDGFVMPAAIGAYCWIAANARDDRSLVLRSENFRETVEVDLESTSLRPTKSWSDYPIGVAVMLERAGLKIRGANLLIQGEVPIGAGLSSSAAIEVATACALLRLAGLDADHTRVARICQQAENDFVGMRCGIMDQFASLFGKEGHAILLDCRSLEFKPMPIPKNVDLVICNTMVRHALASSEYNRRRADCEEAVRILSRALPGVRALRDVSFKQLARHKSMLPEIIYRRALHIVSENARVIEAGDSLKRGDVAMFGRLMAESHASLRDLYEVSCPELDLMVELANKQKGILGARMTGGGFGGCTINLVDSRFTAEFRKEIGVAYENAAKLMPEIYVWAPAGPAGTVTDSLKMTSFSPGSQE
ncbi:MAG: galactokinase [Candidatus Acidiferrales bacterium]|jgi:galactokinase